MAKRTLKTESAALQEKLISQLDEDRSNLMDAYKDLRQIMITPQDYSINGMNLTKLLELLTKQTAQLLEVSKLNEKNNNKEDEKISNKDQEEIFAAIEQ